MSPDAFQWAYKKYIANDPQEVALYQEERIKAYAAQGVYNLRDQVGLSRKNLSSRTSRKRITKETSSQWLQE
jgi:hypothetical protein